MSDIHAVHHLHKRKRIHQHHEQYPHPNPYKRYLDKAVYVAAMVGPIMTLPQVYKIWILREAAGVSAISWTAYLLCAIVWVAYGVAHKEWPIIFSNVVWILLDILIVIGTVMFGSGLI